MARIAGLVSKGQKIKRVEKLGKVAPKSLKPHISGRLGIDLAIVRLAKGYKVLAHEVRFYGEGETVYTVCDLVVKAERKERKFCVEVKNGDGSFTKNQLHYHRHKYVVGNFKGPRATTEGLVSDKPETVWMMQMCFKSEALVGCKLD